MPTSIIALQNLTSVRLRRCRDANLVGRRCSADAARGPQCQGATAAPLDSDEDVGDGHPAVPSQLLHAGATTPGSTTEMTRQLRQGATQRQRRAAVRSPTPAPPAPPTAPASSAPLALPAAPASPAPPEFSSSPVPPAPLLAPASPTSSASPASQSPSASAHDEDLVTSLRGDSSSLSSPGVPAEERTPPMSPSSGERAVTAIFAEVPRDVVVQGANKMPHRNAGELIPSGISSLLRELAGLCETDVFLDIGSGVGYVVVQVVLATNVAKAVGVEVRQDLNDLGMKMIAKSVNSKRLLERSQLVCQDIMDMRISVMPPYADATVVFWNKLLFEPRVIEFVKEELSGMFLLRQLVSSMNFCARHRDLCHNAFCQAFQLEKVLYVPCSRKADILQVCVYESK
ncbi:unnamed protein product [Phytophthora fragariaefolia]|uniref:Histone-lysine N-methyltransferase, H3 lysine-79 specific n=1 Tax=Phytophthora fragariaefolia TaxID=1490495 RepID=A0A9W7D1G2_9STRA|nr:unnamed protein product [Phytophthora fragariaefolia]